MVNNLPGVVSTIRGFEFAPGCGRLTTGVLDTPVERSEPTSVPITFDESQTNNDCSVTYYVELPDGTRVPYTQLIGTSTPPTAEELAMIREVFVKAALADYTDFLNGVPPRVAGSGLNEAGVVAGVFARTCLENWSLGGSVALVVGEPRPACYTATEGVIDRSLPQFGGADWIVGEGTPESGFNVQELLYTELGEYQVRLAYESDNPPEMITLLTDAYSFSGTVADVETTRVSFVINLAEDRTLEDANGLTTPTRIIKQLRNGDWRGVDNVDMGVDGGVSYTTPRQVLHARKAIHGLGNTGRWINPSGVLNSC